MEEEEEEEEEEDGVFRSRKCNQKFLRMYREEERVANSPLVVGTTYALSQNCPEGIPSGPNLHLV